MLSLQLVFGSEDYNDLVNSGFPTDVFGIFVNGVNYGVGARNVVAHIGVEHQLRRPDVRPGDQCRRDELRTVPRQPAVF